MDFPNLPIDPPEQSDDSEWSDEDDFADRTDEYEQASKLGDLA